MVPFILVPLSRSLSTPPKGENFLSRREAPETRAPLGAGETNRWVLTVVHEIDVSTDWMREMTGDVSQEPHYRNVTSSNDTM